ncbi:MAG: hypothetical protein U9R44_01260 [Candidatus Omnitrophota bacterium]|nr:hypothetical protein [Candidatus Omnitrophota bacterium]
MKKFIFILVVFTVSLNSIISPASAKPETIRVLVEVVGDQQWEVEDYVKTILSSLEDVEVVEDYPSVYIHIITRRLVSTRGKRLGYVIASASAQVWEVFLEGGYPFHCNDYHGLWLEVGPDLRDLSLKCVAAVNAGVFEKIRELNRLGTEQEMPLDSAEHTVVEGAETDVLPE